MKKQDIFLSIKKAENIAQEALEVAETIKDLKKELTALTTKNIIFQERMIHRDNIIAGLKQRVKELPTVEQLQQENEILRQRIETLNQHIQWQQQTTTTN